MNAPAILAAAIALAPPPAPADPGPPDAAAIAFFESRVRPVLVDNCSNCHSASTNAKGGLRVDDRLGLLAGGSGGPAVVPGDPEASLLIQAVRYEGPEMPPKKRLSDEQIADLERWIADGAAWPPADEASAAAPAPGVDYEALRRDHWAWQPLRAVGPPEVRDPSWPLDDLDRFVLARLEAEGLAPAPDADRAALLRRVTFDLAGLPPTPEEIDAFLADESPDAFETVVDRLLASPAFGERWGRHWLDVARYGESTGSSRNVPYPQAWRYRDYVIDAFNADTPYDVFLREQVAGDLLPAASASDRERLLVATGFLALGVKDVNQRFQVRFVMDNVDEQIDAVSRSALALTVSCARCHDHKFDPIPQRDYYALAGIFRSTELCAGVRNKMGGGGLDYYDTSKLIVLDADSGPDPDLADKVARAEAALAEARAAFQKLRDDPEGAQPGPDGRPRRASARQAMNRRQAELSALTDPAARGATVILGVRDAKQIGDTEVRLRGEAEKLGPVVPRGFLSVLDLPDAPAVDPARSGRLELAAWLTCPSNPLTPRVMVNRTWHHLFGRGIVASVDNFGTTGDAPSHPELLDHLAGRFVAGGWSVKRLVRSIVLSRAYRLGSVDIPANRAVDPENRLVWRHRPRRLDAEQIRDATLAAAGVLDRARPAASPASDLKVIEIRDNGPEARRIQEQARRSTHRSVYLPLLRGLTPPPLEPFDPAEQGMVSGRRDATTVAPQALYLLNDPFVRRRSLDLASRLLDRPDLDDPGRVRLAYRLALGREPTAAEVDRASRFLAEYEPEAAAALAEAPPPPGPAAPTPKPRPEPRPAAPVLDPDQVVAEEEPVVEEAVDAPGTRAAAWAALAQALFGSAEFRYLR